MSVSALIFLLAWPYLAHAEAKSTWRGLIVHRPESISGTWEAKEGSSVIGLEIRLTTEVGGRPLTLRGVDQTFLVADIEVYERHTPQQKIGDGNWFQDNSPGVEWDGWHLRIRPTRADQKPIVALDLILNPASGTWTGRYHRGSVDHDVVLTRPSRAHEEAPSPFVGTWSVPISQLFRPGAGMLLKLVVPKAALPGSVPPGPVRLTGSLDGST